MKKKFNLSESENVELKRSLAEKQEILETISAFSNTAGGTIYIGIDPGGDIVGVNIGNQTLENLANDIKQKTDPKVFPTVKFKKIEGKEIVTIEVSEYPTKPVWAKDKVFLRVGRSNQRASAEKIRQLILEGKEFKWDNQVSDTGLPEIDAKRVKSFLQKVEEERNTTFEGSKSTAKVLEKLKLITDGKLTNGALLLFGKNPQKYFVQSEVRCARFNGTEPVDFADMQVITGTIIEQVPAVLNFIRRHINVAVEFDGQPQRKEVWEYPKEAIREGVINAICHRNYEDTGNVQVRIFDDRLEIWNPGPLPFNLTIEMLRKHHQSKPRNDLIARCFYLVKYIEQWGTGTNRMIKLCMEAKLPGLDFFEMCDSFIVIFRRKTQKKKTASQKQKVKLNKTQKMIIEYLEEHREASTNDLAKFLNLSRRTVQRNIIQMDGLVVWSGESLKDSRGRYTLVRKK